MATVLTDHKQAQQCANLLQALAEPNRIRIIDCLRTGPKNVTQLADLLGVEIVNVSHHLGVLRNIHLVQAEKSGRFVIYSLAEEYFAHPTAKLTSLDLGWCKIELSNNN